MEVTSVGPTAFASGALDRTALRTCYELYRRQQAMAFLAMVPRASLRTLVREASLDATLPIPPDDALGRVTAFVERRLPLPPFEVWYEDVGRHPGAHFAEGWMYGVVPDRHAPLALDETPVTVHGTGWRAVLKAFLDGDTWRGFVEFVDEGSARRYRTADVFSDAELAELRGRFRSFDASTLEAFLRSIEPDGAANRTEGSGPAFA